MFALLRKSKQINLPIDVSMHVFDYTVSPVLLYSSEIWATCNYSKIESTHLKLLKYSLHVNQRKTNSMIYGEVGRCPLKINILSRLLTYWARIVTNANLNKLTSLMYKLLLNLHRRDIFHSPWLMLVKTTLNNLGMTYIWNEQYVGNIDSFRSSINTILNDQYRQEWQTSLQESSKCTFYKTLKSKLEMSKYLYNMPFSIIVILTKFIMSNHRGSYHGAKSPGSKQNYPCYLNMHALFQHPTIYSV